MTQPRLTRRRLLNLVGRGSGAAAVYHTMAAMGLLAVPAAARPFGLAADAGRGTRVVVLGAGIAGLVAAYELARAGFACTVIEARARAGGRNWTIRRGDLVEEVDSRQTCAFDPGDDVYFNAGPARLPQHHQSVLGYCKTLGVPLEVMVNENRNAYFHGAEVFGGRPLRARQVINDGRGFIAELLAKAVSRQALDQELSGEDRDRIIAYARSFGALDPDLAYRGSFRAGFSEPRGAGAQTGRIHPPIAFKELLRSDFWHYKAHFGEGLEQASPMLQPVGGMDQIVRAFERAVGHLVAYGAEVREIRRSGDGVRVVYRRSGRASDEAIAADYAICTLPLPVLSRIDADVSPAVHRAMSSVGYVRTAKLAFQARRRFWEEEDQIYGGISWTDQDITQIWYPSTGFHGATGILVGAYIWTDAIGVRFGDLSPEARAALAASQGQALHAGYADQVDRAVSVAWHKLPYSLGGWAEWSPGARASAYKVLTAPDGPIHFAGDHLSYLSGWQEGAVLSAQAAVAAIAERVRTK